MGEAELVKAGEGLAGRPAKRMEPLAQGPEPEAIQEI